MRLIITYLVPMRMTCDVKDARAAKDLFHALPVEELVRRAHPAYCCPPILREIEREDGKYVTDLVDQPAPMLPGAA